eukprot:1143498-Heterocapsa_arctica.AAC.1
MSSQESLWLSDLLGGPRRPGSVEGSPSANLGRRSSEWRLWGDGAMGGLTSMTWASRGGADRPLRSLVSSSSAWRWQSFRPRTLSEPR